MSCPECQGIDDSNCPYCQGIHTIDDNLYITWTVRDCPCGSIGCSYSIIPEIKDRSGAIRTDYAQHIVALHNEWLPITSEDRRQNEES